MPQGLYSALHNPTSSTTYEANPVSPPPPNPLQRNSESTRRTRQPVATYETRGLPGEGVGVESGECRGDVTGRKPKKLKTCPCSSWNFGTSGFRPPTRRLVAGDHPVNRCGTKAAPSRRVRRVLRKSFSGTNCEFSPNRAPGWLSLHASVPSVYTRVKADSANLLLSATGREATVSTLSTMAYAWDPGFRRPKPASRAWTIA